MAEKNRHPVIPYGEQTSERVSKFAALNGYSETEARTYLCQYALNRLATLARNAAKKDPNAKEKAAAKKKKPLTKDEIEGRKARQKAARAAKKAAAGKAAT